MKQNSTNIYISNCTFHTGLSFAMGSIGQYPGQINVIENITAENIILHNTIYGARVKTVRKSRSFYARLFTDQNRSGLESIRVTRQMAEVSGGLTYQGTKVQ
jgi:polygalacturonase